MDKVDFTPVHTAKLTPADLAMLTGSGRVSCSYWLNGYKQPHSLHREKVRRIVDAIRAATQSGALPVPMSIMRRERAHYIRQALKKVAR